jgi:alkylation response protein AidB-like acyl-CoA dehydrogenase
MNKIAKSVKAAEAFSISENAELLARARALVPLIREHRAEAEKLRRAPPQCIDAIHQAGLFRIFVPREYGGYEVDLGTAIDIYSEIGRGCASTAWAHMILATINLAVCLMSDQAQREVFGENPDARVAGVFVPRGKATPVEGGYKLSGTWPFCSGCHYGDWFALMGAVINETGDVVDEIVHLIPAKDVEILDDWHVTGLRGSGSNSVRVKDIFIPQHRTVKAPQLLGYDPPATHCANTPIYRSAMAPLLTLVLATPALGAARSAIEEFKARMSGRSIPYTFYTKQSEAAVTHLRLGEATTKIDTAEALARHVADEIDQSAARNEPVSVEARMRLKAQASYVSRLCLEGVEMLYLCGGGSAISESSPIQRISRDLHAANLHGLICFDTNTEAYGRTMLGLAPNTFMV